MAMQNFRASCVCGTARQEKEHWTRKDWPVRSELISGSLNILVPPLGQRSVFPLFHIKLGVMNQFVKALRKDGHCFRYICMKFPGL